MAYNSNWHDVTTLLVKTLPKGKGCSYSLVNVSFNDNAFYLPVLHSIL